MTTWTTDLAGRPAAAVAMPTSAYLGLIESQEELLYDPDSALPLGSRLVVTRNLTPFGEPSGTVVAYSSVEASGFTDSVTSTTIQP